MSILIRRNRPPSSKLDDILVLNVDVAATLNASVNDWDTPELQNFTVIGVNANVAGINIGGIEDGFPGRILILGNVGVNTITLLNENIQSLARNRLILGAVSFLLNPSSVLLQLIYLGNRWRRL